MNEWIIIEVKNTNFEFRASNLIIVKNPEFCTITILL